MDVERLLQELDALLAGGKLDQAELRLRDWIEQAEDEGRGGAALTFYNELEGILRTTGRAREAAEAADKALALIARMGLEGTVHHATTLLNAATANRAAGELDKALAMYQAAEKIYLALGQGDSYQMAALWNNISQVYQEQGKNREALDCLERALPKIMTMDCAPEAATTRVNMALSLMALDRLDEAEERLQQAIAYYDSEGARDPHRSSALSAAGELAFRRGEKEKALSLLEGALETTLACYGENDACRVIRENIAAVRGKG
jgi:tetratricopeptide (TPR) repeat protein